MCSLTPNQTKFNNRHPSIIVGHPNQPSRSLMQIQLSSSTMDSPIILMGLCSHRTKVISLHMQTMDSNSNSHNTTVIPNRCNICNSMPKEIKCSTNKVLIPSTMLSFRERYSRNSSKCDVQHRRLHLPQEIVNNWIFFKWSVRRISSSSNNSSRSIKITKAFKITSTNRILLSRNAYTWMTRKLLRLNQKRPMEEAIQLRIRFLSPFHMDNMMTAGSNLGRSLLSVRKRRNTSGPKISLHQDERT
mmetsp:Transcript_26779/g.44083  ORF Transcript_26779/g.44083 Transcript_26779/m.44083 type:complete len:245 (-) Transcript_26779:731-1465(-)